MKEDRLPRRGDIWRHHLGRLMKIDFISYDDETGFPRVQYHALDGEGSEVVQGISLNVFLGYLVEGGGRRFTFVKGEVRGGGSPSEQLRELRISRDWTQPEAAEQMGISKGHYIKLERGEREFTRAIIFRAAEVFGVNASTFLGPPEVESATV